MVIWDVVTRWWFNIKNEKKESGQTLVELALVLPFLLILIFGTIEFGRIFHATHVITSAAREGARAAAVHKTDPQIEEKIEIAVSSLVSDPNNVDELPGDPGPGEVRFVIYPDNLRPTSSGSNVWVEVKGTITIVTPVISSIIGETKVISSRSDMRLE